MALTQLLEIQFFTDCLSIDFVDKTVYGSPEDDRVDLAVYLFVTRKFEDPADDLDLSPANSDPVDDAQWNVLTADDGHYEFTMLSMDIWDNSVTYNIDDIVHYLGIVYKGLVNGISVGLVPLGNPTEWELVTDLTTLFTNLTVTASTFGEIVDCRIRKCHKIELVNDECLCGDCDEYSVPLHTKLFNMLNAAQAKALELKFIDAEKIIQTATDMCVKTLAT